MADPRRITRDMLHRPIDVHVNGTPLNLKNAKVIADEKALEFSSNPILLAWFEKKQAVTLPISYMVHKRNRAGWYTHNFEAVRFP